MSLKPTCRIGDHVEGICNGPGSDHPRHFVGTWVTGSNNCTADGLGLVRVGDVGITDCSTTHHFTAVSGSSKGSANGLALHRVGDSVLVTEGGSGVSTTGSSTVSCE